MSPSCGLICPSESFGIGGSWVCSGQASEWEWLACQVVLQMGSIACRYGCGVGNGEWDVMGAVGASLPISGLVEHIQ